MAFNGTNKISNKAELMHERIKYQLEAYPENNGLGPPMIKNTNFAEMNLYGHVNPFGVSIYPKEDMMKDLDGSGDPTVGTAPRALEIVKDMHREMKANIEFNVAFGKLFPTIRSIATMAPRRAYESPINKYNEYLDDIIAIYNDEMIPQEYGITNITTYDKYVKFFMKFITQDYLRAPIVFSTWLKSGYNSIYSTGLAVGIMDKEFDIDLPKETFIYSGNLFDHYKRLAMNKGFSIMHNAPWCLIADLGSPAMNPFYDKFGFEDIDSFFASNFKLARERDIQLLQHKLRINYNNYVTINPYIKKHYYNCNKSYTKIHTLIPQATTLVNNSSAWIRIYTHIRNTELGNKFGPVRINRIIKKALKSPFNRNQFDMIRAIGYIDSIFRADMFNQPFGLRDIARKQNKRRQHKIDKQLSKSTSQASYIGASVGGDTGMASGGGGGSSGGY
tara:strand:- start:376 stop:1713 length:1338 start_codon:yes stop_codon:yes gene_type:complete